MGFNTASWVQKLRLFFCTSQIGWFAKTYLYLSWQLKLLCTVMQLTGGGPANNMASLSRFALSYPQILISVFSQICNTCFQSVYMNETMSCCNGVNLYAQYKIVHQDLPFCELVELYSCTPEVRENTWTGVWLVFASVASLLKKSTTSTVKCKVQRATKSALCIEQC